MIVIDSRSHEARELLKLQIANWISSSANLHDEPLAVRADVLAGRKAALRSGRLRLRFRGRDVPQTRKTGGAGVRRGNRTALRRGFRYFANSLSRHFANVIQRSGSGVVSLRQDSNGMEKSCSSIVQEK